VGWIGTVEVDRSNGNPCPAYSLVRTPCRGLAAGTEVVVVLFWLEEDGEEVAVDIWLVERQEGAVVAMDLDCPGHIASRSTVVGLMIPGALRFPLFGSI